MAEALQLIDSEGRFNVRGLDEFVKSVHLASYGLSYAVVSIMGAQSSGKSTLLNHLFGTSFKEMNALLGRAQTTQGVWLAKATGIDPCTLVVDLEGTDGRERGELIYEGFWARWCFEIGREHAANKPLLKTVFEVMLRLFTPRKTTLLFVIRDKTLTPIEILESSLRSEVLEIWDSISKPESHRNTPLTEFFNVEVTALSHYHLQEEEFKEDVLQLRQRFANSIKPGGLAGDRRGVVPGTAFSVSTEAIWKVVKDNKDLDLPTHQVMVATVRCGEIAQEKLSKLASDKEWMDLDETSKRGPVPGFGKKVTRLVESQITSYDDEAAYFEDSVRRAKRDFLVSSFIEIIRPAQGAVVGHHRNKAVKRFKQELETIAADEIGTFAESIRQLKATVLAEFDKGCEDADVSHAGWENIQAQFPSSNIRDELQRDLESHSASVQARLLFQIVSKFEERLEEAIVRSAASLLEAGSPDTWPSLRKLVSHESELVIKEFASRLVGLELDKEEETELVTKLRVCGRNAVRMEAKAAAGNALSRMKERFNSVFTQRADSTIRTWTEDKDVRAITKEARIASLKLLSVLAAMRLEDTADGIESALLTLVGDDQEASSSGSKTSAESTVSSILGARSWDGVAAEDTLLTPVQCKDLWRQFKAETQHVISQAMVPQVLSFGLRLEEAIVRSAASLLEAGSPDTWPSLRKLVSHESELVIKEFASRLAGLELDKEEETKLVTKLRVCGRNAVRKEARDAAGNALSRMKERFNSVFTQDADSIIRTWTGDEDVRAITKDARTAALKLLSVLAAIRLEETADGIESALLTLLGDNQEASTSGSKTLAESTVSSLLAARSWDGIAPEDTLLTPVQCQDIWRQFKSETHHAISQAIVLQTASRRRRSNSFRPPMWAIVVVAAFGCNQFMAALRNPIHLVAMVVLYLLGKAVWVQLDITAEFQDGFLRGMISIIPKLLPTIFRILKTLANGGQQMAETN